MMKQLKKLSVLVLTLCIFLTSNSSIAHAAYCVYTNTRSPIYVDYNRERYSFKVYVNGSNALFDVSTTADWIHFEKPYGTYTSDIYYTVDENIYNRERSADIKITFRNDSQRNPYDVDATFQIIQKYHNVSGRTDNLVMIGDDIFNPGTYTSNGQRSASIYYDKPIYLDTKLPMAFCPDSPYNIRIGTSGYSSENIRYQSVNNGPYTGTLYYQLTFSCGSQPKTGGRLYNQPSLQLYFNGTQYTITFANIITANAPYTYNGSYSGSGSSSSGSGGFSTPNASQTNWDDMQRRLKEWGTKNP